MLKNWYSRIFVALIVAGSGGCSEPAGLTITDVDKARAAWLQSSPDDYSFEVSTASSWFPKSGYFDVEVRDRTVVSVHGPNGEPVEFQLTLDELWEQLLAARAAGQLHLAHFTDEGVPIDVDYGPWEVDGGMRYWIRDFTPR